MNNVTKQRTESEASRPQGQGPSRVSRTDPSWTEFVAVAHQAVVAITERTTGVASNEAAEDCGSDKASKPRTTQLPQLIQMEGQLASRNNCMPAELMKDQPPAPVALCPPSFAGRCSLIID